MPRLTQPRPARALPATGQRFLWCSEVQGFGVPPDPDGADMGRPVQGHGRTVRHTLGRVGTLPFEGPPDAPGAEDLALAALNATRRGDDGARRSVAGAPRRLDAERCLGELLRGGVSKARRHRKQAPGHDPVRPLRFALLIRDSLGREPVTPSTRRRCSAGWTASPRRPARRMACCS